MLKSLSVLADVKCFMARRPWAEKKLWVRSESQNDLWLPEFLLELVPGPLLQCRYSLLFTTHSSLNYEVLRTSKQLRFL